MCYVRDQPTVASLKSSTQPDFLQKSMGLDHYFFIWMKDKLYDLGIKMITVRKIYLKIPDTSWQNIWSTEIIYRKVAEFYNIFNFLAVLFYAFSVLVLLCCL